MRSTRIQTAHLAGHFYKLTLWLLYADMYKFMAPVIKTCLYLSSERECLGVFLTCAPPKRPTSDFFFFFFLPSIYSYVWYSGMCAT